MTNTTDNNSNDTLNVTNRADESGGEGNAVKITGPSGPERGPEPDYAAYNNNNHGSTALYGPGPPLASSFRGY
jgi:hypothetical protein